MPKLCPHVCPNCAQIEIKLCPNCVQMILRFIQLLADLAHATSDACYNDDKTQQARDDRRRESKTHALTLRVILAQCELEKVLPMCKFTCTPLMHALRNTAYSIEYSPLEQREGVLVLLYGKVCTR